MTARSVSQVKNWGSGQPAELDHLQVDSFAGDVVADEGQPFYTSLARQLELLEVRMSCILFS